MTKTEYKSHIYEYHTEENYLVEESETLACITKQKFPRKNI